ncbi:hypothetical protein FQR65_LT01633 [Abscondita terminalis]|nr:hypothetical protein FQR65_LT01633 [Abscondita terminalis]
MSQENDIPEKQHNEDSETNSSDDYSENEINPAMYMARCVVRAMKNHARIGELKLMSPIDLEWLSAEYLISNTSHAEIEDAWLMLPPHLTSNEEIRKCRLCKKHWNIPKTPSKTNNFQIRDCQLCKDDETCKK